mmetsp:Transcript_9968/g.15374  ORF Transcript_9968/g.15374 Transcript_9968/m.15374 type:complete len:488 (+) Transcript_9968:233-1696(+)|eukprot:CAMPEP_0195298792 /NCGR_PEP_ID=MMETSP0707-20130614/24234_1 /TAXON_ID=33640 /ORGANISM="Asterionellopsis glacialis, Strain CCMP134" /LENGTH=487 /DNA_ID=CAMNT_0040361013 /DNA_START=223 /DNA_END=1686 /DNA_ORIENTATION=-
MTTVTVSDPRTIGEGRNMYTSYRVETSSKFVRRRYSDFRWLYQRLHTERPGSIIPIIPHTRALTNDKKFSDELIHERQIQLGAFLAQVCDHVELADAPSLTAFLSAEMGDEFETQKKDLQRTKPDTSGGSNDIDMNEDYSFSSESVGLTSGQTVGNGAATTNVRQTVRNVVARAGVLMKIRTGQEELETTEQEAEILSITEYIDELTNHVKGLNHDATVLVKSGKETAVSLHDMGQSLFGWALAHQSKHCPEGSDPTVNMLSKVSKFSGELSSVIKKKADEETTDFEHALVELQQLVHSIKVALNKRKAHQVTYTTRMKQISSRQAALGKLQRKGQTSKISGAEQALADAEREAVAARKDFEAVSQRVVREAERVQPDVERKLTQIIKDYAKIQIEYNKKTLDAWSKLAPHLDLDVAVPTTTTSAITSSSSSGDDDSSDKDGVPTADLLGGSGAEDDDARPPPPSEAPPEAPTSEKTDSEADEEVFI